jgi:hypothetical protein
MLMVGFVLLTSGAHAASLLRVRADGARSGLLSARGDHAVLVESSTSDAQLWLKSGFSVLLRRRVSLAREHQEPRSGATGDAAGAPLVLRVAKQRPLAAEIAASFIPIGPTVELTARAGRADVAFTADHFRVRRGHRLVLAVEQPTCMSEGRAECVRWRLKDASYETGRCIARGVQPTGLRLQFGSLSPQ